MKRLHCTRKQRQPEQPELQCSLSSCAGGLRPLASNASWRACRRALSGCPAGTPCQYSATTRLLYEALVLCCQAPQLQLTAMYPVCCRRSESSGCRGRCTPTSAPRSGSWPASCVGERLHLAAPLSQRWMLRPRPLLQHLRRQRPASGSAGKACRCGRCPAWRRRFGVMLLPVSVQGLWLPVLQGGFHWREH